MVVAVRSRMAARSRKDENRFRTSRGKRVGERRSRTHGCNRGRRAERDDRATRSDDLHFHRDAECVQARRQREDLSPSR